MNKEVIDIPTIELKAFAYDLSKQFQFIQNQLSVIEQELIRRAQLPAPPIQNNESTGPQ